MNHRSLHATCIDVPGIGGVLLIGKAGIGKSTLALELIKRGARLISDDLTRIQKTKTGLSASCPPTLKHILYTRRHGFINVLERFGPEAIAETTQINKVIHLIEGNLAKEKSDHTKQARPSCPRVDEVN